MVTFSPRPAFHAGQEVHLTRRLHFNVAAAHLDVRALRGQQHMLRRLNCYRIMGAGHRDGFVCGDLGFIGLRPAAEFAAGSVQLNAGFLIGLFEVAGFAVSKEADARPLRGGPICFGLPGRAARQTGL